MTSTTFKAIVSNIRRPDAVVLSYAALLIQFYPSPSRLLSLMDPILMFGILLRCLNAYQDPNYLKTCPRTIYQELKMTKSMKDIYISPLLAEADILQHFPKTVIIASDLDPCLDENVQFYSKLVKAGVAAELEVIPGLPHGFLSFCNLSEVCQAGVSQVTSQMRKLLSQI